MFAKHKSSPLPSEPTAVILSKIAHPSYLSYSTLRDDRRAAFKWCDSSVLTSRYTLVPFRFFTWAYVWAVSARYGPNFYDLIEADHYKYEHCINNWSKSHLSRQSTGWLFSAADIELWAFSEAYTKPHRENQAALQNDRSERDQLIHNSSNSFCKLTKSELKSQDAK